MFRVKGWVYTEVSMNNTRSSFCQYFSFFWALLHYTQNIYIIMHCSRRLRCWRWSRRSRRRPLSGILNISVNTARGLPYSEMLITVETRSGPPSSEHFPKCCICMANLWNQDTSMHEVDTWSWSQGRIGSTVHPGRCIQWWQMTVETITTIKRACGIDQWKSRGLTCDLNH